MEAQPSLRKGSYGNSVEEWAEARLFEYWLLWVSDSEKKRVPFLLHDEIRKEIETYIDGIYPLIKRIDFTYTDYGSYYKLLVFDENGDGLISHEEFVHVSHLRIAYEPHICQLECSVTCIEAKDFKV